VHYLFHIADAMRLRSSAWKSAR